MNRNFRITVALLAAISMVTMFATDDPETGVSGIGNQMVLTIIFIATFLGGLRFLKKISDMC